MTAGRPIHAYDSLQQYGRDLYCLDGRWKKSPLDRRMTLVRHSSGRLAVHSAIRLREDDYGRMIDALGDVALILVPNSLHADEACDYAARYPRATVLVPSAVQAKCAAKLPRVDGSHGALWPADWSGELRALELQGTRMGEALFWHIPSRTLIATDLVFHFTDQLTGLARTLMRWNGVVDRVGPSRIFRWFFLTDRRALVASLQPVKHWDFDRIVMSHGTIIESGGKRLFLEAFAPLGL